MTKYGSGARSAASRHVREGLGRDAVARALGIPPGTVRKWQDTFRSVGREVLLGMGERDRTTGRPRLPPRAPWSIRGGRSPKSCASSA